MVERCVVGWDIGGAHVKAVLMRRGAVLDAAQWPCPLWKGLGELEGALAASRARWPDLDRHRHAVTMTGEMVDAFADREDGVRRIAQTLSRALPAPRFFAGDAPWCDAAAAGAMWHHIASANWLATARHAACVLDASQGVVVDIGSTTTDLIAFKRGRVLTASRGDALRLARSELVYQGVVRTPLCALARRIAWRGTPHNVMNELFATSADVYRLTGELDPAHDLYPSADNAAKDLPATRQRLARMVGLDQREGTEDDWLVFARWWREAQVAEIGSQLRRVMAAHSLGREAVVVSAGCGDFLVPDVLAHATARATGAAETTETANTASAGHRMASYGRDVAHVAAATAPSTAANRATVQAWAQVCAPCVAAATLFEREQR